VLTKIFGCEREVRGGGRTVHKGSFITLLRNKYCHGNQKRHVGEEKCVVYMAFVESLMERDHLEDLGVDWRIILK
jgi:hypothetical protein